MSPDPKFIIHQIAFMHGDGWHEVTAAQYAEHKAAGRRVRRVAVLPLHTITARVYVGAFGSEYVAELRDYESGNVVFTISGSGQSRQWEADMRDAMHEKLPNVYPNGAKDSPTRYFREVCNVPYDSQEVRRKKDL